MDAAWLMLAGAGCFALAAGFAISRVVVARWNAARLRRDALAKSGAEHEGDAARFLSPGIAQVVLGYLAGLDRRLAHGTAQKIVGASFAPSARSVTAFEQRARFAGVKDVISLSTIREGRVRLAFIGCVVGAIVGACLSNELALLLGVVGLVAGIRLPGWAIAQEAQARSAACKRELPELLEVVSLGLNSGLTFDRSFSLYHTHFDTGFARACASAQRSWSMGFSSREEALRHLSDSYDSALLKRVVDNVSRSMRFGTSLAPDLEKAAEDSQAQQRAARQEEVAKAPVKMMVPTATLILPAMLLMVLGPVLLELMNGF